MGLLKQHTIRPTDKIPAGFKTCRQWADDEGLSIQQTGHLLRRLMGEKTWECQKFRISGADGFPRLIPHYRPKSTATKK